jgi:hypothetical protein
MVDADFSFNCAEPNYGPYVIEVGGRPWGFQDHQVLDGSVLWLGPWTARAPFPACLGWPLVAALLLAPLAGLWILHRRRFAR